MIPIFSRRMYDAWPMTFSRAESDAIKIHGKYDPAVVGGISKGSDVGDESIRTKNHLCLLEKKKYKVVAVIGSKGRGAWVIGQKALWKSE